MADFCMTSDPELSDVADLCGDDEMVMILCEGCGEMHFIDRAGYRLEWSDRDMRWVRAAAPPREDPP